MGVDYDKEKKGFLAELEAEDHDIETLSEKMEKPFYTDAYIKNTAPLTDEEFNIMIIDDHDEISVDHLDFDKKEFNILNYCRVK